MLTLCFCLPDLTKVLTNGPLGILQNLNHICICKHLTTKELFKNYGNDSPSRQKHMYNHQDYVCSFAVYIVK